MNRQLSWGLASVGACLSFHEAAARCLDDLDITSRLLSPSAATGVFAAAATVGFLLFRSFVVFVLPAALAVVLVRAATAAHAQAQPRS